ncbi:Chitinase A [Andreprevotia sp. IGB-42]|uniref:basic secretory protein-like protein n=1 Tax=Andreprevotia sp. IGB-42 TaxID=2497473 RepID=UPI0013572684|nr:basic secretory protein-like protein [Andreprevotia sp. IGB-42]KAF0812343.1 Chitinase A [Andreprevotia sp. IGB-42]
MTVKQNTKIRFLIASLFAGLAFGSNAQAVGVQDGQQQQAATAEQYPAWSASTAYVGGSRVSFNGQAFEARWWTQAEQPTGAEGSVWKLLSALPQPVATFYEGIDYTGYGIGLPAGSYTKADLIARGIKDNDLSSLKIDTGYVAVLYDAESPSGTGKMTFATTNQPNFFADDFNDRVSSIRIIKKTDVGTGAAPAGFHGTVGAPTRINLSWNKNPGDEIYVLEQLVNGSYQEVQNIRTNQSYAILNNLTPGTAYTYRVYAINASGKTLPTAPVTLTTWTASNTGGWDHFRAPNIVVTDKAVGSAGSTLVNTVMPDLPKLIADQMLGISRLIYFSENDQINLFTDVGFEIDPDGYPAWKSGEPPVINMGMSAAHLVNFYNGSGQSNAALINEVIGMIAHEGTHGYQYTPRNAGANNEGGAFVEGLADYVRIELGLHPAAVRRPGALYNAGYSETGFFIKWLTDTKDPNFARKLNASARDMQNWSWDAALRQILGQGLDVLWAEYQASI